MPSWLRENAKGLLTFKQLNYMGFKRCFHLVKWAFLWQEKKTGRKMFSGDKMLSNQYLSWFERMPWKVELRGLGFGPIFSSQMFTFVALIILSKEWVDGWTFSRTFLWAFIFTGLGGTSYLWDKSLSSKSLDFSFIIPVLLEKDNQVCIHKHRAQPSMSPNQVAFGYRVYDTDIYQYRKFWCLAYARLYRLQHAPSLHADLLWLIGRIRLSVMHKTELKSN